MANCVWLLETKWPNGWKPIGRVYRNEANANNAKAQMTRKEWAGELRVVPYVAVFGKKRAKLSHD